ncbi:hypothetical protein HD553DRAFT_302043 [Filobasidium floriforme]|uniref:uncharacterized protein n=1 Tax=Filobasidium floriforme TaxID=5210 RepID=UPI001E8D6569|nr:uncharacterized protein HD553DRAFT_302043 [Filobasidium floriforme]KAH8090268.1 hypothetical protein HD553DRAFT_302043 [Filobasidium floriforme]
MREVVLGVGVGKSGGHEGVRGFGFAGWKPTSLFLHEPSTDNSPPSTTNTVTNTAATTSRPSAPAPASAPAPSSTSAPSPSAPSNPSPSNPNPSNPSPSSPSSNPQGLELKPDSRISTTVLILLPSPKYPYTYTDHSARSALTPEMKMDRHGQLRGERDEKKKKKEGYEVKHVEDVDVHVADVSDIKDAGDAWGRVMSWGEGGDGQDAGVGVDRTPRTGLAGTLSLSGSRDEQEVRDGQRDVREKSGVMMPVMMPENENEGRERPPVQIPATSSSLPPAPPTHTQTQGITSEVHEGEEEDDLPDFVLGVLELEVVADTPDGEIGNSHSGDQVEAGVSYPPKLADSTLGQAVGGVSPRTDTEGSPMTMNGTGRERPMPTDGLMRSFWRR